MREVFLAGACRTAIGKFGGSLSTVPAAELGATVIKNALAKTGISASEVDEIILGCVLQAGLGQNVARQAALQADIPNHVPAQTLNVVCGSGLQSVNLAAALIQSGQADIVIAGGTENMSAAPYALEKARNGYRMNDGILKDLMVKDALWDAVNDYHMGITAENVAKKFGITREEQDAFAVASQNKCEAAVNNGLFADEIVPIEIKTKKETIVFDKDEFPRQGVTIESINHLHPAFLADGTVTAANSSGINDGAAAVVLISREKAEELGVVPMAK
jgi:acetyl-CoA C-acetyltransferase